MPSSGLKVPAGLPAVEQARVDALLAELEASPSSNPFHRWHVCPEWCGVPWCQPRPTQHVFAAASTRIQAAFCGNRWGKTTTLVCKCLVQHAPDELLPERLKPFKIATGSPVTGRILCPSEQVMVDHLIPSLQMWCPPSMFRGGSWSKAWDKAHNVLHFKGGGRLGCYTYKQDPTTMGSSALDYVGYDEPPPEAIRNESLARLIDRDGFEMFAMTPVNMVGGGIGWIYRTIYKRREHPDVTVVSGEGGRQNPSINQKALERVLSSYSDEERRAREFGDFMHFGGMVYPGGFEKVVVPPLTPQQLDGHDIVVGIDPGLKKAAFVWGAFDNDNRCVIFDERVVQEGTPADWVGAIREVNLKWGIKDPLYVIDPSARNRSLTDAESVEGLFQRQGIYPIHGQNQVFAGVSQIRLRIQDGGFFVTENCRGLRDEAEEYREEDRPDEEFKVVKERDHELDATRYLCMSRPWYVTHLDDDGPLGWEPNRAPDIEWLERAAVPAGGPMGPYS